MADVQNTSGGAGPSDEQPSLESLQPLLAGIKSFHGFSDYSDLVIKCQGREWKVHKAIVCAQSDFFKAAVGNWKEAQEGIVNLDKDEDPRIQDDPLTVETFVHYMYNFAYDSDYKNEQQEVSGIVLDVRMYIIAGKYFVKPLMQLAAKKFKRHCESQWSSSEFAQAAQEVYHAQLNRDSELKQAVINAVKAHAYELLAPAREEEFAELHTVLQSTELGANVAQALISACEASAPGKTYVCSSCGNEFTTKVFHNSCNGVRCPNGYCGNFAYNPSSWEVRQKN